jgi:pilus assembly protein CpaF
VEGKGEVTQRALVRNALRMRPDRIVLGEVRGAEALDMLNAMNTGHEGSLATLHANTARNALSRLETMVMTAGMQMPVKAIRAQIASAVNIVIQVSRLVDGRRKVLSIQEVTGMEGDVITMQELFHFHRSSIDANGKVVGYFAATGVRPFFFDRLTAYGQTVPDEAFSPNWRIEA